MAKITVDDLQSRGRFTAGEFDWDDRTSAADDLRAWLQDIVDVASAKLETDVGSTNYAATTTPMTTVLKHCEMCLALSMALQRRFDILTGRPEEAPPPEYIDTDAIRQQIISYRADYDEWIASYRLASDTRTGAAFSFGATGVEELGPPVANYQNYVPDRDYGNIEDQPVE